MTLPASLPVWLISDPDDDTWVFVAAPTRGSAKTVAEWAFLDLDWIYLRCRRILATGKIGGRGPQAVVECDAPRELTGDECAAFGYRVCVGCGERWTGAESGYCYVCEDERAAMAEGGVRP